MPRRRPQVLPESQDLDPDAREIPHRLNQLVVRFSHPADHPRLRQPRWLERLGVLQYAQSPVVAAARADEAVQPLDRLQVVAEDLRARPHDNLNRGKVAYGFAEGPALPVADVDRSVADEGRRAVYRDIEIDDTSYRMITFPMAGGGAVQVARDVTESETVLVDLRNRLLLVGLVSLGG